MKTLPSIIVLSLTLVMMSSAAYSVRCICYDTRTITRDHDGYSWVKYRGCHYSRVKCYVSDTNHFGCYGSYHAAKKALHRCRSGNPRFVD